MLKENDQGGEAYVYGWTFALLYTYISTNHNFSDNHEQTQVRGYIGNLILIVSGSSCILYVQSGIGLTIITVDYYILCSNVVKRGASFDEQQR